MNTVNRFILKAARKLYLVANPTSENTGRNWRMFSHKEYANGLISEYIERDAPCMIARFGANELACLVNYIGIKHGKKNWSDYIKGRTAKWWWDQNIIYQMEQIAGFFPATLGNIEKFCELMLQDMKELDVLGSWLLEERIFDDRLKGVKKVVLEDLEPFFTSNPWTYSLENKKVLVVHPFAETIVSQYQKRQSLFENGLLPNFELKTLKAVLSLAGEKTQFRDWFDALEWMKKEIDKIDFDVAIIGCGAYGFSLAAHVKRNGKKAVHMGGATQLLFGIKGKRWEDFIVWPYSNLFNDYWIRPGEKEKPKNITVVEGGCYW